jgi:hypothetical protein
MRRKLAPAALALAGILFGIGSGPGEPAGKSVFLVYSSDERGELHPCG